MNDRKKISLYLLLSLIGFGVGYVLTNSIEFGICIYEGLKRDPGCLNFYERLGDPIFYGMGALVIIFLVLLLLPKAFPAWKKFALWSVPLVALLFIFYPDPGSGDLFTPFPETLFKWVSGIYLVISLGIIAIASVRKSKA